MQATEQKQHTGHPATGRDTAYSLDHLPDAVRAWALRLTQRGWTITGVVMTQPISSWKSIVDESGTRGVSPADIKRIMTWEPPRDSGAVPGTDGEVAEGERPTDAVDAPERSAPPADGALTRAVENLAVDIGCRFIDSDSPNSGWRAPGKETVYASALEALTEAVHGLAASVDVAELPRQAATPRESASPTPAGQEALF